MILYELREKANRLPLLPGVYIMMDESGEVIYVGKAIKLKNRVASYFRGEHDPKTTAMASKVADFDVIIVGTEFEAFVLENSLIKRHKPKYNILLRDDKSYPFLRLDYASEYPRFSVTGKAANDGARYFGPFSGRSALREVIDTVSRALGLPSCGRKFPRDIGKNRPCLNHHMGACAGWCRGGHSSEDYRRLTDEAVMIIEGKTGELISELTGQMESAAEELRFELAASLRDRIRAVERLESGRKIVKASAVDTDYIGFYRGAKSCFTVMHYIGGALLDKDYELFDEPLETDAEAVSLLVSQYYTLRGVWPKTVCLPCEIENAAELERFLSEGAGRRVYVETPKRGEKRELVERANINAREESERVTSASQKALKTLEWLQKALELPQPPERIEAFDVSNTGSFGIVAAMTVFQRGRPLKRDYRKFRIKDFETADDYGAMREAVGRRFRRYLDNDEKFSSLPSLLLIDGGATHASACVKALDELGLRIPVYGMVKDDRHRTRALMSPDGQEIGISGNPAVFALIGTIQEETHRFAIEYHRSLRSQTIGSELDSIPGVGEKRRNQLLSYFKTMKAIRAADMSELRKAVPVNTAKAVWEHFHTTDIEGETDT